VLDSNRDDIGNVSDDDAENVPAGNDCVSLCVAVCCSSLQGATTCCKVL